MSLNILYILSINQSFNDNNLLGRVVFGINQPNLNYSK